MIYITTFLFGLLFGSFLNVCIYRIPRLHFKLTESSLERLRNSGVPEEILRQLKRLQEQEYLGEEAFFTVLEQTLGKESLKQYETDIFTSVSCSRESIVFPGSHCPHCGNPILPWDNIPVLSFIILGGKCRSCNTKISFRYPLIELLTAILFVTVMHLFGLNAQTFLYLAFIASLIVISFIDIDYQIIPDVISKPGIVIGILASLFPFTSIHWYQSALGALVGGGVILGIVYGGPLIFKQDAMGLGDVKLMAMIGAFLGWKLALLTIFLGSVLGAVTGGFLIFFRKTTLKSYLPFGPFLCTGGLISLVSGEYIFLWYWNLFFTPQ